VNLRDGLIESDELRQVEKDKTLSHV
jgi:hypothetical protein